MKAIFFRHGPAVPRGTADADRPLTPEGRRKTTQAAKGLRTLELDVAAIYSSPLSRAMQTADILADVLHLPRPRILEALRPETSVRRLLSEVRTFRHGTLVLVGHEPMLSAAVALAVGGRCSLELKKAGMALVDVTTSGSRPGGTLKLVLSPAVLRKLGSLTGGR